jgi:hypothetical protein
MKIRFLTHWVSTTTMLLVALCFAHQLQAQLVRPSPTIGPSVTPLPSPSAAPSATGRTDNSLTAVIASTTGKAIAPGSCRGVTSRVGLDPGQVVTITLQFPPNRIADKVVLEPLDGGVVFAPGLPALSAAGILQFQFQANQNPGLTQVRVGLGADDFGLQFYVLDSKHPGNNPRIPSLAAAASETLVAPLQNQERERRKRRKAIIPKLRQPIEGDAR